MIVDREKIEMSDEEIEALFDENFQVGLTVDNLTFYERGEMDRIRAARANWVGKGTTNEDSPTMLDLDDVQAVRGQRRQHLCAIAIGDYEAIYCE